MDKSIGDFMAKKIKKKKTKKTIKIGFDTSKTLFKNGLESHYAKEKLFCVNSISRLESELNKHNIELTEKQVIEEFEKTKQIQKVFDHFNDLYVKELDELSNLNILFDDDCIILFIDKVIELNYKKNEIPDPDFIAEEIENFRLVNKTKKYETCLKILNNIKNISKYEENKNICKIFEPTCIDINYAISELIGIEIHNLFLDLDKTITITNLVFEILEIYDFDYPVDIYKDALGLLVRHGYEKVKEKFEKGLEIYPNDKLALYNSILIEIDKIEYLNEFIRLYNEAIQLPITSESDKDYMEIIKDNFEYEIKELTV